MNYETVNTAVEGRVARITLNRPEARNSANQQLRFDLRAALEDANSDDSVRVILLSGEGKGFCAGADLVEKLPGDDEDGYVTTQLLEEYAPIITAITESPKPVISAIQGAAAGVGMVFAISADLLLMSEDAFLYSAFGDIALIPDAGAHYFLRRALGPKKAFEIIAFSQRLTAQECLQQGIANRVVPVEELWPTATQMAEKLAQKAPLALKYSKKLLNEAADENLQTIIEREAVIQNITVRSEDCVEGKNAFFEKRPAQFKGR